jgi:hypothetical protein
MTGQYANTEHNKAKAIGGPLGVLHSNYPDCKTLNVPVLAGDGWGSGRYKFEFGMWVWEELRSK